MDSDKTNDDPTSVSSTFTHKKEISPSKQFVAELKDQKSDNTSDIPAVPKADKTEDENFLVRDSFSTPSFSHSQIPSSKVYASGKFAKPDHQKPTAFELAQMPKGVYVIGVFGLVIAIVNMVSAFSVAKFVVALFSLAMAAGLLFRLKSARYLTIGFAVLVVLLNLLSLASFNQQKDAINDLYTEQQRSITTQSEIGLLPDDLQSLDTTNIRLIHDAKLRALERTKTYGVISIVVYSLEALYLLRPRVRDAFK